MDATKPFTIPKRRVMEFTGAAGGWGRLLDGSGVSREAPAPFCEGLGVRFPRPTHQALLHLTVELQCEINTLGYPRAALFGFACAAVAFNTLGVVKAALRAAHGVERVDHEVSGYYLVNDLVHQSESLEAMVEAEDWAVFRTVSACVMAAWLIAQAARLDLRRYRKHPRGPKKAPPKRVHDPKHPHVSIARLLTQRKKPLTAP